MECYETCVDVGKRCKFTLRKTSCCDCGKISTSRNFAPSDRCCGCDKKQPCSSRSACACAGSGCANPCSSCKEYRKKKQTCWEWICSLFGFGGKKDEGLIGTANGPCSKSSPCPPRSIGPKSNSFDCGTCRPETLSVIKELKSKEYSAEYKEFKSPYVKREDRPEENCYDTFEKTKFWADCFKRPPPVDCSSYSPAKNLERSAFKEDYIPKAENSYQTPEKTAFSPSKIKPTAVTTRSITPSGSQSRARSRSRSKSPKPYLRKPRDSSNRSCSFTLGKPTAASVSPCSKPLKRSSSMCTPCGCPRPLCPCPPLCDPCCPSRPCSPCPRVRSSSFNSGLRTRCCGPCVCSSGPCPCPCPIPLCPCPPGACPCPPAPCCPVRSRCTTPKSLCTCTPVCPKKKKKPKACSRSQSLSPCAAAASSKPCGSPCPPCNIKSRGNAIQCPCKVISPHVYIKPKYCLSSSPPCCSTCVKPKPCSTKPCHKQQRICPKPVPCACRVSTLFPTSTAFAGVGRNYARSKEGDSLCKQLMAKYSAPSAGGFSSGKSFCCPSLSSGGCRACLPCPAGGTNTVSACSPCFDYTYSRKPSPRNKQIKDSIEFKSFPNEKTPRLEFDLSHKIYSPCVRQRGPRSPTAEYLAKLSVAQKSPGRGIARLTNGGLGDPASSSQRPALLKKKKKGGKKKMKIGGGENVNNAAAETTNNNRQGGWFSQHRLGEEEPIMPSGKTQNSSSRTSAWDRDGSSSVKGTTNDEYFGFFRRYLMISPVPFTFSEIVDNSLTTTSPTTGYAENGLPENGTEAPSAVSYPCSQFTRPLASPATRSTSAHQKDHEHFYGNKKDGGSLVSQGAHESHVNRPFHRPPKSKTDSKYSEDGRNGDRIHGYNSPKSGHVKGLVAADKKDKPHFAVESTHHLETRKASSTYPNACDCDTYVDITKEHPHLLSVGTRKYGGSYLTDTSFDSKTVSKVKEFNNLTSEKSDLKLIDLEVHNTDLANLKIKESAASSLEEKRFADMVEFKRKELNLDNRKRVEFGAAIADKMKADGVNMDRKKFEVDNVDRMVLDMINSERKDLDLTMLNGKELGKANKEIMDQKIDRASWKSFGANTSTRAETDATDSQMAASNMNELERAQTIVGEFQKMELGRSMGHVEVGEAMGVTNAELKGIRVVEMEECGESSVDGKEWSVATMNGKNMGVTKMEGEELGGANLELREMGVANEMKTQLDVMQTHDHSNNPVLPIGKESSVDYEPDPNMEACTILQLSPSSQRLNPLIASIMEKCSPQNHILDGKESSVDIEPFEQFNIGMVPNNALANIQSEKRKSNPTPVFENLFGDTDEPVEITIRTKESCGARNFSSAQYRNPKAAVNKEKKAAEKNKSKNKADECPSGILSSLASTGLDVRANDSNDGGAVERSKTAAASCSQITGTSDAISSVSSICSVSTVAELLSDVNPDAPGESSVDPVTSSVTATSRSAASVACDVLRESSLTWQKVEDSNIEPWLIRNAKAAFMSLRNSGDSSGVANGRTHPSLNTAPAAMSTDPTSPGSIVDVLKPLENCSSELGRLAASTSGTQDELNISTIRESGTPV